jgi:hypothetical protein
MVEMFLVICIHHEGAINLDVIGRMRQMIS